MELQNELLFTVYNIVPLSAAHAINVGGNTEPILQESPVFHLRCLDSWIGHEIAIRLAASISYYFLNTGVPTRMICNGSDCITDQVAVIPTGSGLRHVNAIAEVLARIDLTRTVVSCTDQLHELTNKMANSTSAPLYIMISNSMSNSLQDAFEQLIKTGSSAMWIAPLYEDMELRVRKIPNMDIIRWEVNKYEN